MSAEDLEMHPLSARSSCESSSMGAAHPPTKSPTTGPSCASRIGSMTYLATGKGVTGRYCDRGLDERNLARNEAKELDEDSLGIRLS